MQATSPPDVVPMTAPDIDSKWVFQTNRRGAMLPHFRTCSCSHLLLLDLSWGELPFGSFWSVCRPLVGMHAAGRSRFEHWVGSWLRSIIQKEAWDRAL